MTEPEEGDRWAHPGKAPGSVSRWLGVGLELQLSERSFRARLEWMKKLCPHPTLAG